MKNVKRTAYNICTTLTNLHSLYQKIVDTAGHKLIHTLYCTLIAKSRVTSQVAFLQVAVFAPLYLGIAIANCEV